MRKISLTRNKQTLVDDNMYDFLNQYKWRAFYSDKHWYAARQEKVSGRVVTILMHRVVANTPKRYFTDHINGNGLDNRRSNLRICTTGQNIMNSVIRSDNKSGYKGVWQQKNMPQKWYAQIYVNKKRYFLGTFSSAEDAAHAYDSASMKHHGIYGKRNFTN